MSDKKIYKFAYNLMEDYEEIESRGYKKAVKSFQNKFPKLKEVEVKDMKQAEEMIADNSIYDDYDKWEYGKSYDESYVEEVEENKK